MRFPGGKELVRKIMTKVGIKFKIGFKENIKERISRLFGRKVQDNFGAFRPIIETAIDEGVINSRSEFIPDDSEAAELGVGAGGSIDRERTNGAWTQLLVGSATKSLTFSVTKDNRKGKIGTIVVSVDEDAFFKAPLSNVDTPDSEKVDSLPWMRWLINGAVAGEILPDYAFSPEVKQFGNSRTGAGRMISVEGGIWVFAPSSLGAFKLLNSEIERQIGIAIRRDVGKVL